MTDFPDLKMKALISFPARVIDGTGIDAVKSNGSYQFNLDYSQFAEVTSIDPDQVGIAVWNQLTDTWARISLTNLSAQGFPLVLSTQYPTGSDAVTDAIADTGGGTIIVPNGAPSPTLPASYPNIIFDYYGPAIPVNHYSETGPSESTATRLIRGQLAASTTGTAQSVLAIESRPTGASINGPEQGSYALNISAVKQGWTTTTQPGEIGGLNVVVRNGGTSGGVTSDASALLTNVQIRDASGFAVGIEGDTSLLNPALDAIAKQVHYHIASIDTPSGTSQALVLGAYAGTIDHGILIQSAGSGSFTKPFEYKNNAGATKFLVDTSGNIIGNDLTITGSAGTSYTPTVTPQNTPGAFAYTASAKYLQLGKVVEVFATVGITTLSTAAGYMSVSLPAGLNAVAGQNYVGSAMNGSLGKFASAVVNYISASTITVFFDGATFPATGANSINIHVRYMTS